MTFIGADREYQDAEMVLFGAPYDSTTSFRPGARFGPSAMRMESFGIETFSPYQDRDLEESKVHDAGDLELPFGAPDPMLDMVEAKAAAILSDGKMPVLLGGEHLVTLGEFRAVAKKYPDVHIIHFDAHCDLRDDYLGVKLSHACVLRRCHDIVGDGRIFQFGIRSGDRDEFEFAKTHTYLHRFDLETLDEAVEKLKDKPVYFTLDLDVLDPSEFPGTGTPEAGGGSFKELHKAVMTLSRLNIVGLDMNELSPVYDPSGRSTALACKLLREILLAIL
jgi:agmatinase